MRYALLMLLGLTGCSTAPIADLLDVTRPGGLPRREFQKIQGGVEGVPLVTTPVVVPPAPAPTFGELGPPPPAPVPGL